MAKIMITEITTQENIDGVEHTQQDLEAYISEVTDYMREQMAPDMTVDVKVKIIEGEIE